MTSRGHEVVVRAEIVLGLTKRFPDEPPKAVPGDGAPVATGRGEAETRPAAAVGDSPDERLPARMHLPVVENVTKVPPVEEAGGLGMGGASLHGWADDRRRSPARGPCADPAWRAPAWVSSFPMAATPIPTRASWLVALSAACLLPACASRPLGPAGGRAAAPSGPPVAATWVATSDGPAADRPADATLAADVARLASSDFVARQHAAERLVAAGPPALDALGRAGDQTVSGPGGTPVSTTAPVVRSILAVLPAKGVTAWLSGPWAAVRREAADDLGHRGRLRAVPSLIERLDDDDVGVRLAASRALRRLAMREFGYRALGDAMARAEARDRWRQWWRSEGHRRAEADDGGEG